MSYLPFHILWGAKEKDPDAIESLIKYMDQYIITPHSTRTYIDDYGHHHSDLDEDMRSIGLDTILKVLDSFEFKEPPDDFE